MKFTIFLLIVGISQVFAVPSYAQNKKITLKVQNATLENVIRLIEEQSEFLFFYSVEDVDKNDVLITVDRRNSNIQDILEDVARTTGLHYRIKDRHIILTSQNTLEVPTTAGIEQQTGKPVSGFIKDASGEPVIGANIVEQGTTNGTISSIDGDFRLNVSAGAVLDISSIGYKPVSVKVGNQDYLAVTLQEDNQLLDEVVIVGYGTVRKANLTGAVDQISSKVLEDRPVASVAQALQGTIANLNISSNTSNEVGGGGAPGARMSFNIRGVTGVEMDGTSMKSSSGSPLFVIDGIQAQDINDLNADDIESISVLKDAASAAIYGSSAPHGVILITTKKGKKGSKPTISYSTNLAWSAPINLPTMLPSPEWADLVNFAQQNTNGTNYIDEGSMQRIRDYYDGKISTTTIINPGRTGDTSWANFDSFGGNGIANDNINWYDALFRNSSFAQQHNVSLQGGTDISNYYVGFGYNHKDGLLKYGTDSFERYSVRANLSSEINKWVTANVRGSFSKRIDDMPSSTGAANFMQQIAQKWPIVPLKNPDGWYSKQSDVEAYRNGGRAINTDNHVVITGELVVKPLKGWDITANYTYSTKNSIYEKNVLSYKLMEATGNEYYMPSWNNATLYTRGKDSMLRQRIDDSRHTINAFTSYEWEGKGHYLKGMVGFVQEYVSYYKLEASSGNMTLYNPNLPTFDTAYYDENGQAIKEPRKDVMTTRGVFGRINYGYKDKYLLELNGRYDGNSRYLKDVRFKFYPGLSGAWVVSQESFWQDSMSNILDFLKIRASYGSLGESLSTSNYYPFYPALRTTAPTSANWFFDGQREASFRYPILVNPNLTWVTNTTVDIGLDLVTLNNRLSATFDYYVRQADDILGPAEQLPATLGIAPALANNASLRTNGFELTLNWKDRIQSIGLTYGVKATLSDSKTKVRKFPNASRMLGTWYDGATVGEIWGYVTDGRYTQAEQDAGIDQNVQGNSKGPGVNWSAGDQKYKDLDGDGLITRGENTVDDSGDRKIIGNSAPRYNYGITLDASWKGFDISMFFHGVGKRDAYISNSGVGNFWGTPNGVWQANFLTIHRDRWSPETPNGYFPKYYFNQAQNQKNQTTQTQYLQDASFLRFKNLQIGYTLPQSLLRKVSIERLRIYISGENLATFSSFVNTIDPEFAGADRGLAYPLQRTWSVGLNLSF